MTAFRFTWCTVGTLLVVLSTFSSGYADTAVDNKNVVEQDMLRKDNARKLRKDNARKLSAWIDTEKAAVDVVTDTGVWDTAEAAPKQVDYQPTCELDPTDDPCVEGCGHGMIPNPFNPNEEEALTQPRPAGCNNYSCICADSGCLKSWTNECIKWYMQCQSETQVCGSLDNAPTAVQDTNIESSCFLPESSQNTELCENLPLTAYPSYAPSPSPTDEPTTSPTSSPTALTVIETVEPTFFPTYTPTDGGRIETFTPTDAGIIESRPTPSPHPEGDDDDDGKGKGGKKGRGDDDDDDGKGKK